jgi:hypothetical protein
LKTRLITALMSTSSGIGSFGTSAFVTDHISSCETRKSSRLILHSPTGLALLAAGIFTPSRVITPQMTAYILPTPGLVAAFSFRACKHVDSSLDASEAAPR